MNDCKRNENEELMYAELMKLLYGFQQAPLKAREDGIEKLKGTAQRERIQFGILLAVRVFVTVHAIGINRCLAGLLHHRPF